MSPIESFPLGLNGLQLAWESVAVVLGALLLGLGAGLVARRQRRSDDAPTARLHERELATLRRVASDLARAGDVEAVVRTLLDEIGALFEVDFVALTFVSDDGKEASGFLARSKGSDLAWWTDVRVDLQTESSGIASAVFEASAFAVYDVAGSTRVSSRLADAVGAKSAAYIPLVSNERVTGVISVATTAELRAFSTDDLAAMQALASEATIALERTRSTLALGDALERERFLAAIARRLRTELDLRAALAATAEETARALDASRCAVELDGEVVADHGEPDDGAAVLSEPIVADGDATGALVVERARGWTQSEHLLLEAVAAEMALAIRLGRLLEENRDRLEQQTSLLRAAQVLSGALELDEVLQRLADEVARLLHAEAADCYLLEGGVLRCAAAVRSTRRGAPARGPPAERSTSASARARSSPRTRASA